MTDQLTYVVAPNHRIGADAARRHGVPVRNVIVNADHIRGMGSTVRLLLAAGDVGLDDDVLYQLEVLRLQGHTDQEWIR